MKIVKPVHEQLLEGNKNRRSARQLAAKIENEIHLGAAVFTITDRIKRSRYAMEKWQEVVAIFKHPEAADYVTNADIAMIERYCLTHAAWCEMHEARERIMSKDVMVVRGEQKEATIEAKIYQLLKTQLDSAMNKKIEILNRIESELLLTPLSRIRYSSRQPKQKKNAKTPLQEMGFE